jgi:hypothetical protein
MSFSFLGYETILTVWVIQGSGHLNINYVTGDNSKDGFQSVWPLA